jgi:hypothetical protein
MKKISISILLVCYFAVSSGIVVNFHYCMNKLASTEFFATEGKKCGKCGMNMHKGKGCCHDEVKVIKMGGDQKVTAAVNYDFASLATDAILPSAFIATSFYNTPVPNNYNNHSPPLRTGQDIYIQNCVFRI